MTKDKPKPEIVELRIHADPAYLSIAREAIRKATEIAGLAADETDGVILAVDEALTNVIRHSYGGPCDKPIVIQIRPHGPQAAPAEALEILIRDFGRQVDPKTIKSRSLDEVRPGGLGVHIIQTVMDDVQYRCVPEGGMELRMVKRISRPDNSASIPASKSRSH
ncbi:MAG: ATP-binding protein [Sedimentisphaerales bacterium]|nr:ATP-binding protein [Sedimentisphaerales bacterium]